MTKPGFIKKIGKFFRQVKMELKKVNWPSKKELKSYTTVVLSTVVVLIIFIWIVDTGLRGIFSPFIM